jgi:hypothetical protein
MISGHGFPPYGSIRQNSAVPTPEFCRSDASGLQFDDVLSLKAFLTLGHLKFHFLVFRQGLEAFTLDGAVMHKDIRTILPGYKAVPFRVIKPFNFADFLHVKMNLLKLLPAAKAGTEQSAKKNRRGTQHPVPICSGPSPACFQADMLHS